MKIPLNLIPDIYNVSKQVNAGVLRSVEGVRLMNDKGLNKNSATDYIYGFKALIEGKLFTRTLNAASMEFFMDNIYKDFGLRTLNNALIALELHIEYFENAQKSIAHSMRKIFTKYSRLFPNISIDDIEQNEINKHILTTKSREEVLNELKSLKVTDPEIVIINHIAYKRDNRTIAQIKFLREYKCQICNTRILKRDGSYYVEAAHIIAKHKKGRETPDNIILLCPNHHKEFDLGNNEIIFSSKDLVMFIMNDKRYEVNLKLV